MLCLKGTSYNLSDEQYFLYFPFNLFCCGGVLKKPQHRCRGLNIFSNKIAMRHFKILNATTNYCYVNLFFSFAGAKMWGNH